jgi:hypothetical protein
MPTRTAPPESSRPSRFITFERVVVAVPDGRAAVAESPRRLVGRDAVARERKVGTRPSIVGRPKSRSEGRGHFAELVDRGLTTPRCQIHAIEEARQSL